MYYEENKDLTAKSGISCMVCACLAWRNEVFVECEPLDLHSSDKRRCERAGKPLPTVRVVRLRRKRQAVVGGGDAVERETFWQVRGHWRRLPVPRKRDGVKVVYVRACVKGNLEGKPLLRRQVVLRVER